jgi:aspartate/methionine/tyrosine aminotransferase
MHGSYGFKKVTPTSVLSHLALEILLSLSEMLIKKVRKVSYKELLSKKAFLYGGGQHAPYIWVKIAQKNSWEAFDFFLQKAGVIVAPGIGFGPSGEGFIRISGLGTPSSIAEVASRISLL